MKTRTALGAGLINSAEALVRARTGLVFSDSRRTAFADGLLRAMQRAGTREPEAGAYLERLAREAPLLDDLVGEITIGETYFFREPEQFRLIEGDILPALRPSRGAAPLRLWSAGCATGEEAYTLAIATRELGARILATDLCRSALAVARRGRYGRWSLRGVSQDVIERHFARAGDKVEVAPGIRDAVEFRYLNLAADVYPSLATGVWGMDLILCRNVLIYLDAETIARVARRLLDSLADDGWLLLGASDPPLSPLVPCEVVVTRSGLAYRRAGVREEKPPLPAAVSVPPLLVRHESTSMPEDRAVPAAESAEEAGRCYTEGDYARAADLAATQTRRDPGDSASWILLVRSLANEGRLEEAGRACAAALDRHLTSAELTYLHATLLAEAGRYRDAAVAARRALYLDRTFVLAHFALGGARARSGDRAGASRSFRNAERLLARLPPDEPVRGADGEPAGRLAEMARVQVRLLEEAAA